eukprot:gnl/Trimastix_PCT/4940.p1 GENE.gnl/Trimastix_PCT/4940~~gnl/Trimastix_PCT/4940.p1  ORF type:complete len:113 (+),score=6.39 gnl/Trimastix_PCT/4940:37-375(+)
MWVNEGVQHWALPCGQVPAGFVDRRIAPSRRGVSEFGDIGAPSSPLNALPPHQITVNARAVIEDQFCEKRILLLCVAPHSTQYISTHHTSTHNSLTVTHSHSHSHLHRRASQ